MIFSCLFSKLISVLDQYESVPSTTDGPASSLTNEWAHVFYFHNEFLKTFLFSQTRDLLWLSLILLFGYLFIPFFPKCVCCSSLSPSLPPQPPSPYPWLVDTCIPCGLLQALRSRLCVDMPRKTSNSTTGLFFPTVF